MDQCKSVLLAQSGEYRVHTCSCGTVNLHLDSVTLRVSPQALFQISSVLGAASKRYLEHLSMLQKSHETTDNTGRPDDLSVKDSLKSNTNNDEIIH